MSDDRRKNAMWSAVIANCLLCMDGNLKDVKACPTLYMFRPGGGKTPRVSRRQKGVRVNDEDGSNAG